MPQESPQLFGELLYKVGLVELSMGDLRRACKSMSGACDYLPADHALLPLLRPMLASLEAKQEAV